MSVAEAPGRGKRPMTVRRVIVFVLSLQIGIALLLMGGDLLSALPRIAFPSTQPDFDTPVLPGDQTRRYSPEDLPLGPAREGNPARPYRSAGDMPKRLSFEPRGEVLVLTGSIAAGDAQRFEQYLETSPATIDRVRLNSPGGSVRDALRIGQTIRTRGLQTLLGAGDVCLSACPYVLAGGSVRQVHETAQVGVHQHYFGANTALPAFLAVEDIQRGQGEVMAYLQKMGVDPLVMQHALVTPPDEIYVLLPEQLETYRMVSAPAS